MNMFLKGAAVLTFIVSPAFAQSSNSHNNTMTNSQN